MCAWEPRHCRRPRSVEDTDSDGDCNADPDSDGCVESQSHAGQAQATLSRRGWLRNPFLICGQGEIYSIPTLGRRESRRRAALDPDQFSIVVVDEAHHATAETYQRIVKHLGLMEPDTKKLLVGFTATPKRSDGIGLDAVFDEISFSHTIPEMMHGWIGRQEDRHRNMEARYRDLVYDS